MPHVIVKLWPKPEVQKRALADAITQAVMQTLGYGEDAISVSVHEIPPAEWAETVYKPDILNGLGTLYKNLFTGRLECRLCNPCSFVFASRLFGQSTRQS